MRKHVLYLRYVLRHKWFVLLACWRYGLIWRGLVHDWTKFLPSEWCAYAEFFYGSASPAGRLGAMASPNFSARRQLEAVRLCFNAAWLRHQRRNAHHWQHRILREDSGATFPLPMPRACVLEMVADWEGAGRAITRQKGTTWGWYQRNKHNIQLHPETRREVEALLRAGLAG